MVEFCCILTLKCVSQPSDVSTVDSDNVKTKNQVLKSTVATQKVMRGAQQTLLFVDADAGGCAAKIFSRAQANLYEDQGLSVDHDDIDLPGTTGVILLDGF